MVVHASVSLVPHPLVRPRRGLSHPSQDGFLWGSRLGLGSVSRGRPVPVLAAEVSVAATDVAAMGATTAPTAKAKALFRRVLREGSTVNLWSFPPFILLISLLPFLLFTKQRVVALATPFICQTHSNIIIICKSYRYINMPMSNLIA
jgi:hypothetical protein